MLELLTFDLVVNTPHMNLLRCLETLSIEENKSLRNTAWAFLNDSCMTPLCLMMPASDITVAAIYFAVKLNNETLPDIGNRPWWYGINGDPQKIVKAVSVLDRFWTENPLRKSDHPYGSSSSSPDDLERTRRGSENMSSTGEFSDNFESLHTPKIPDSSKSRHVTDDSTRRADTESCQINKTKSPGSKNCSKNENADSKTTPRTLENEKNDSNKLSNQSDGHVEPEEGEATDKDDESNPSQIKKDVTVESHAVNSIPIMSPPKRKLSDHEVNEPKEKRLRTEEHTEEG